MEITRYNYGRFLPTEDDLIEQGRNFSDHEKSCNEVANILFPIIDELTEEVKKWKENSVDLEYKCLDKKLLIEKLTTQNELLKTHLSYLGNECLRLGIKVTISGKDFKQVLMEYK